MVMKLVGISRCDFYMSKDGKKTPEKDTCRELTIAIFTHTQLR